MTRVYVGIGSNVDREINLAAGMLSLERHFAPLSVSRVFECAAVGFSGDPFYNLVAGFDTSLGPAALAGRLRAIEREHGRPEVVAKYSPRTLDIDLLLYGDVVQDTDGLVLPREDVLKYAFVLWPLSELAPQLRHPVNRRSYSELWADFPRVGMPPVVPAAFSINLSADRGAA